MLPKFRARGQAQSGEGVTARRRRYCFN